MIPTSCKTMVPLYRKQWAECWEKDQQGAEHPPLICAGVELDLVGLARQQDAVKKNTEAARNRAITPATNV